MQCNKVSCLVVVYSSSLLLVPRQGCASWLLLFLYKHIKYFVYSLCFLLPKDPSFQNHQYHWRFCRAIHSTLSQTFWLRAMWWRQIYQPTSQTFWIPDIEMTSTLLAYITDVLTPGVGMMLASLTYILDIWTPGNMMMSALLTYILDIKLRVIWWC